jgi:hypothetical protein
MTNHNQPTIHALVPRADKPDHYLLDEQQLPPRVEFVPAVHRTHEEAFHAIGHTTLDIFDLSVNRRILDHPLSEDSIVFEAKPIETSADELNGFRWQQINDTEQ